MGKDSPKHSIDIHVLDCSVLLTLPAESSRLLQKRQNAGEKTLGRRETVVSAFVFLGEESEPPRVRPREVIALEPWFQASYSQ